MILMPVPCQTCGGRGLHTGVGHPYIPVAEVVYAPKKGDGTLSDWHRRVTALLEEVEVDGDQEGSSAFGTTRIGRYRYKTVLALLERAQTLLSRAAKSAGEEVDE